MRPGLLFIFFLLHWMAARSQNHQGADSIKIFSSYEVKFDFRYLRTVLEKAHPSLYRYISKDELDKSLDSTLLTLNHSFTETEFWRSLQHIITKIGCGHTRISPSQSYRSKNISSLYLPFTIYIDKNKIFIKDYIGKTNNIFNQGDEILSINGVPAASLLIDFRSLISSDGSSLSYKDFLLENGEFNWLYTVTHELRSTIKLSIRTQGKAIENLIVQPISTVVASSNEDDKQPIEYLNQVHVWRNNSPIIPDSILHSISFSKDLPYLALLKIKSFTYTDYLSFHRKLFEILSKKNITELAIDIRGNQGGMDYICIDLLKYLLKRDFYFTVADEAVVSVLSIPYLIDEKSPEESIFLSLKRKLYQPVYPANKIQRPNEFAFKGNIHLLVNGGTFSAASLFAVALKKQLDCQVYGRETGGGESGCDGGKIIKIILPRTHLQLTLPLLWTYSVSKPMIPGFGLMPDHQFYPFWKDEDYISLRYFIKIKHDISK